MSKYLNNEQELESLKESIYLQTLHKNSQTGRVMWSMLENSTLHAREMEPAQNCINPMDNTPIATPRHIWDFYLVRSIVTGGSRYVLDVLKNGNPIHTFTSDDSELVSEIYEDATRSVERRLDIDCSIRSLDHMIPLPQPEPGPPYLHKARSKNNAAKSTAHVTAIVNHNAKVSIKSQSYVAPQAS